MKIRAEDIKKIVFDATYEVRNSYATKTDWEQVARKVNEIKKGKKHGA